MSDCLHPKSRNAKRCRACQLAYINSSPEIKAKAKAAIRAHYADPVNMEKARAKLARVMAQIMADPEEVERRREHGRRIYRDVLSKPEVIAKHQAPEVRAKAGKKRTATVLSWCPTDKLKRYRQLSASGIGAAKAKEIVQREIQDEAQRIVRMRIEANRNRHDRERAQERAQAY